MQSYPRQIEFFIYVSFISTIHANINVTPDMISFLSTSTMTGPETSSPIPEYGTNSTENSSHLLHYQKEKWSCTCYESQELECGCEGLALHRIPQNLTSVKMQKLTIYNTGLRILHTSALNVYSSHLRDVTLSNLRSFYKIEAGAFSNLIQLRTLYIAHAPKLEYLDAEVFQEISKDFKTLRIINCGLLKMPDLKLLPDHLIMHMV